MIQYFRQTHNCFAAPARLEVRLLAMFLLLAAGVVETIGQTYETGELEEGFYYIVNNKDKSFSLCPAEDPADNTKGARVLRTRRASRTGLHRSCGTATEGQSGTCTYLAVQTLRPHPHHAVRQGCPLRALPLGEVGAAHGTPTSLSLVSISFAPPMAASKRKLQSSKKI